MEEEYNKNFFFWLFLGYSKIISNLQNDKQKAPKTHTEWSVTLL